MPDIHLSKWLLPKFRRDIVGMRFALNVFIATTIVWYALENIADTNPIWAIASMIAASDPQVTEAVRMFRSRIINVLVGCAVGLFFVILGGPTIVIAAGLTAHSEMSAVEHGLHKVAEVLFGCVVGVLVSWSMARIWPLAKRTEAGP
jgi:hypothetical protein